MRRPILHAIVVTSLLLGACGGSNQRPHTSTPIPSADGAGGFGGKDSDGSVSSDAGIAPPVDAPDADRSNMNAPPSDAATGVDRAGDLGTGVDVGPNVLRLEVSPAIIAVAVDTTIALGTIAVFGDGTTADVTSQVTFSVGGSSNARIEGRVLRGLAPGGGTLTAAYQGVTASARFTVSAAALVALAIEPTNASLAAGLTIRLTAVGILSDGTRQNLTEQVHWASADTAVATLSNEAGSRGSCRGVAAGVVGVSASFREVTARTSVVVTGSRVARVEVTPTNAILSAGVIQGFQATVVHEDGASADVTEQVVWMSSNLATAVASNDDGSRGSVRAVAPGTTTITARLGMVTGATTVTVVAAAAVSVAITPANPTVFLGASQRLNAIASSADGSTFDVTSVALWSSSAADVLSISNANVSRGVATGLAPGTVVVRASFGGVSGETNATVASVAVVALAVMPPTASLAAGRRQRLTAVATYADSSQREVTQEATWTSSDPAVATVSTTGTTPGEVLAVQAGTATMTASFGGFAATAVITVTSATLETITVSPAMATVAAGRKQRYAAMAQHSDGSRSDVTDDVVWSADDRRVATISMAADSRGLATGLTVGTTMVRARIGDIEGSAALSVTAPDVLLLQITPVVTSLRAGEARYLSAVAILSNGTSQNAGGASWSAAAPEIAMVTPAALGAQAQVRAVAAGSTKIRATWMGMMAEMPLVVTAPSVTGLSISPPAASVRVGQLQIYQTFLIYDDGSTAAATDTRWTWSNPALVSVAGGRAPGMVDGAIVVLTGRNPGTVAITATRMGMTDTAMLTVREPTLMMVEVSPLAASVRVGQTQEFEATAIWEDGSKQTVTSQSTWLSSDVTVATVTTALAGRGVATALKAGSTGISATFMGVTGTAVLTARAASLDRLEVTPAVASVGVGRTLSYQAVAVWDDGNRQDVSSLASWASTNNGIADVSSGAPAGGSGGPNVVGTAFGIAAGTTTIQATWKGKTSSGTLTVADLRVLSVEVTTSPPVPRGLSHDFTATAIYSDFSSRDVTTLSTWTSSNPAAATVSNAAGSVGRANALDAGTANIAAKFEGVQGSRTLTVTTATLTGVGVTPTAASAVPGVPTSFVATATYSDATTFTVTRLTIWSSSDLSVATVDADGTATALRSGTTTIAATFQGVVGSTTLAVRKLTSLRVQPNPAAVAVGGKRQLTASAVYDDGFVQDVTQLATWVSEAQAVAVSNAAGARGMLTGLSTGTTTVTAHFQGQNAGVPVTVAP